MALLEQLGLNQSLIFQFCIFAFAITFLSLFVFKPYADALAKREEMTKGGEDLAAELHKEAADLRSQYETKARKVSGDIKEIFDQHRSEGLKESEKILSQARLEAQKRTDETRAKVAIDYAEAAKKLKDETAQVASAIANKMLVR